MGDLRTAAQTLSRQRQAAKAVADAHAAALAGLESIANLLAQRADIVSLARDLASGATRVRGDHADDAEPGTSLEAAAAGPLVGELTLAIEVARLQLIGGDWGGDGGGGGGGGLVGAMEGAARARLGQARREAVAAASARLRASGGSGDGARSAVAAAATVDEMAAAQVREVAAMAAAARRVLLRAGGGSSGEAAELETVLARWRAFRWVDPSWDGLLNEAEVALLKAAAS
ncbi:hypothetical protein HK405_007174 [Cladochytrium tenue]|nr:hypothetical protein HK405_007174 [Cladochytrium tenue]